MYWGLQSVGMIFANHYIIHEIWKCCLNVNKEQRINYKHKPFCSSVSSFFILHGSGSLASSSPFPQAPWIYTKYRHTKYSWENFLPHWRHESSMRFICVDHSKEHVYENQWINAYSFTLTPSGKLFKKCENPDMFMMY